MFVLLLLYLIFIFAAAKVQPAAVSANASTKDLGHEDIHVAERTSGIKSPPHESLLLKLKLLVLVRRACWILCWCQDALDPSTVMLSRAC
jgi:hypothetical protein